MDPYGHPLLSSLTIQMTIYPYQQEISSGIFWNILMDFILKSWVIQCAYIYIRNGQYVMSTVQKVERNNILQIGPCPAIRHDMVLNWSFYFWRGIPTPPESLFTEITCHYIYLFCASVVPLWFEGIRTRRSFYTNPESSFSSSFCWTHIDSGRGERGYRNSDAHQFWDSSMPSHEIGFNIPIEIMDSSMCRNIHCLDNK